jgi:hypothetical protein
MNRDQLRQALLDGCDRLLGLSRLLLGRADRNLIYLQQTFWRKADDVTLDAALADLPAAIVAVEKLLASMPEMDDSKLLAVARVVVKEFEASNDAQSPTPNLWPSLELLREQVEGATP